MTKIIIDEYINKEMFVMGDVERDHTVLLSDGEYECRVKFRSVKQTDIYALALIKTLRRIY